MARILIVDDEQGVLNALRRMCLNSMITPPIPDPHVTTFTSPLQALGHLRDHPVDLAISDYRMPEMDGTTFLTRVKKLRPDTARMILSAYTDMPLLSTCPARPPGIGVSSLCRSVGVRR